MTHDSDDKRPSDDPGDHAHADLTRSSNPNPSPGNDDATRAAGVGRDAAAPLAAQEVMPERVGDYAILGKLGQGGMGVVYEARQDDPPRVVALKVIRGGRFVDEARVRMFQREVETLARLSHPNIGAIYASGRTEDGQHYFAMELVQGATLDRYLAGRPAPEAPGELEHRLRLFSSIASAVHYAHQRGVIHRDLKPSNIVVSEAAESVSRGSSPSASAAGLPLVKILDFGLARITDEDMVAASIATEVGVIKGTLPYMSPEQARGDAAAIDVRTDVYALGVLLYEMVSGKKPYDVVGASLLEAVRVICEEPPRSLSGEWTGRRALDLDVETIARKALAKEPERRYDSAAALVDDVQRFLMSQPIMARPPSAAYQLKKFTQRHRPMVAGAALALAALVVGAVVSTALYLRAEKEAERARVEAATAEQVSTFLRSMLEGVGPSVAQGRDTTLLKEILERANTRVEEELEGEPVIEAHIRSTIGVVYYEINDFENTERQFTRALEIYRELHGEEHADVAQSYFNLGLFEQKRDNVEKAEQLITQAIDLSRVVNGEHHEKTAQFTTHLGNALLSQGRFEDALPHLMAAVESLRGLPGDNAVEVGIALNTLGIAYHQLSRYDEARPLYEEALALHRKALGDKHPYVVTDLANLAYLAKYEGDLAAAGARFKEALALRREIAPEGDPETLQILTGLGGVLKDAGRYDESEALFLEGLAMSKRIYGETSESVIRQMKGLGDFYETTGQPRRALAMVEEAIAVFRASYGEERPYYATLLNSLGLARSSLGEARGAVAALEESHALSTKLYGAEAPDATLALINLARAYRDARSEKRAEELLREVIEIRLRTSGRKHYGSGTPMLTLGRMLARLGRFDEAIALTKDGADIFEETLGVDHFQAMSTRMLHADTLRQAGRLEEAESMLRALQARQVEATGASGDRALRVGAALGAVLADQGRGDEAEALYRAALDASAGTFQANELNGIRESYGRALHRLGRFEESRAVLEEVYERSVSISGALSPSAADSAESLAELYESWEERAPGEGHRERARMWRGKAIPGGL